MTRFLHHTLLLASFPGSTSPSQDVRKLWLVITALPARARVDGTRNGTQKHSVLLVKFSSHACLFPRTLILLINVDKHYYIWHVLFHFWLDSIRTVQSQYCPTRITTVPARQHTKGGLKERMCRQKGCQRERAPWHWWPPGRPVVPS